MFISGMITHGAFMLTLDLLFSFVLSSVCFDYFLFSLYSTVSYFPYYVHNLLVFSISMLYKASNVSTWLLSFHMYKENVFTFLFSMNNTHHTQSLAPNQKLFSIFIPSQWNEQKSGFTFQRSFQNILRIFHNMGNLIF